MPAVIALAVVTLLVFVIGSLRSARGALSAAVLLRFYLYIASFVTLVVLVAGLSYLLTGLLSLASPDFSYQQPIRPQPAPVASANPTAQQTAQRQQAEQQRQDAERLRDEQSTDLIRGGTLSVLGLLLFVVHAVFRRASSTADDAAAPLLRGYLAVGLVTFGVVGLVTLPVGVYQAIKFLVLPPLTTQPRVAPGNTLATGIVLTPVWIIYLARLAALARQGRPHPSG